LSVVHWLIDDKNFHLQLLKCNPDSGWKPCQGLFNSNKQRGIQNLLKDLSYVSKRSNLIIQDNQKIASVITSLYAG
jgi:hypothetical protein